MNLGVGMANQEIENDPDWIRLKEEAAWNDPSDIRSWLKWTIADMDAQLREGITRLRFFGWVLAGLMCLILWRVW